MYLKILKVGFITCVALIAWLSLTTLAILASIGSNTIFTMDGSTQHIAVPITENAPNILYSLGESFVLLLYSCPLLILFTFIILVWLYLCIGILHDELIGLIGTIKRIRIFTKNGYFIGVTKKETKPSVVDKDAPFP